MQQSVLNADAKSAFYNFKTGIDICWADSLATGHVGLKSLLFHRTFSRPGPLPMSFFTHITLTLAVKLKTVKDLYTFLK